MAVARETCVDDLAPDPGASLEGTARLDLLTVSVAGASFAIPLADVVEVLPAARTESLPGAPASVMGVLDLRGELVAVLDAHRCLGHDAPPLRPRDRFVVLRSGGSRRALRVDHAEGLVTVGRADVAMASSVAPEVVSGAGIARLPDGLLVVHDPERFLSVSDAGALRAALAALASRSEA